MSVLSAVVCPVCGGPFHKVETNCPYCGVMVVISGDHRRIDAARLDRGVINQRIREYRAALKQDVNDAEARYGLGVAYYNLGLIDESIEELQQAARLMPENPHLHAQLGVVLYELSDVRGADYRARAWKHLDRTLLLEPRNEEGLVLKEALLRQRLRMTDAQSPDFGRDKRELSATWRALTAVNGDRARPLINSYLKMNQFALSETLVAYQSTSATALTSVDPRQTWFLRTLAWSIAAFFVPLLLFAAVLGIWGNEDGDIDSGFGNAIGTILVLSAFIAPIVVMIRGYMRRPVQRSAVAPSSTIPEPRTDSVASVLSDDTPLERLLELADRVLAYRRPVAVQR